MCLRVQTYAKRRDLVCAYAKTPLFRSRQSPCPRTTWTRQCDLVCLRVRIREALRFGVRVRQPLCVWGCAAATRRPVPVEEGTALDLKSNIKAFVKSFLLPNRQGNKLISTDEGSDLARQG